MNHSIILFDGICNLCEGSVKFIIQRDSNTYFKFAPLQSEYAQKIIDGGPHPNNFKNNESIILLHKGLLYSKSDAIIMIAAHLDGYWPLLRFVKILPLALRNYFYDIVASNRYFIFGKKDHCIFPTPDINNRFIKDWTQQ
jgi:predicted DCC family thiol-disulfide oxidoreductase YuxK